jgi:hypothetical protein
VLITPSKSLTRSLQQAWYAKNKCRRHGQISSLPLGEGPGGGGGGGVVGVGDFVFWGLARLFAPASPSPPRTVLLRPVPEARPAPASPLATPSWAAFAAPGANTERNPRFHSPLIASRPKEATPAPGSAAPAVPKRMEPTAVPPSMAVSARFAARRPRDGFRLLAVAGVISVPAATGDLTARPAWTLPAIAASAGATSAPGPTRALEPLAAAVSPVLAPLPNATAPASTPTAATAAPAPASFAAPLTTLVTMPTTVERMAATPAVTKGATTASKGPKIPAETGTKKSLKNLLSKNF